MIVMGHRAQRRHGRCTGCIGNPRVRRGAQAAAFALRLVAVGSLLLAVACSGGSDGATVPVSEEPEPLTPAKVILHQQTPPSVADVVAAAPTLDTLPVDGVVVWSKVSNAVMGARPLDPVALANEFAPMRPGIFKHLTDNFALVYATPAGAFTGYRGTVAGNFARYAGAAHSAGFVGIFFDVEQYFGPTWDPAVACPGLDLATCRDEARRAGTEVMRSIIGVWPDVKMLVTFGASVSEPLTANALNPPTYPDVSSENPTYGAFAVGMVQAIDGTSATYLDGSGSYTQNNASDVERLVNWLSRGMAERSPLVPTQFRDRYRRLVSPAPGVYDFPVRLLDKGPGSPAMWENDIAVTVAGARKYVWLYSERFNWLASSRDTSRLSPTVLWLEATQRGIARARN